MPLTKYYFVFICVSLTSASSCGINFALLDEALKANNLTANCTYASRECQNQLDNCVAYQMQLDNDKVSPIRLTDDNSICQNGNAPDEICSENDACGIYLSLSRRGDYDTFPVIVNVSIANSRAHTARFQYSFYRDASNRNCNVHFNLNNSASRERPAFFDCDMQVNVKENYVSLFTYEVNKKHGQFLMKIPDRELFAKGTVPFYVHVRTNDDGTLASRREKLTITLQAYPHAALIGSELVYNISVYKNERASVAGKIVNTSDPRTFIDNWRNLYTAEIDATLETGEYKIVVEPFCDGSPILTNTDYLTLKIKVKSVTLSEVIAVILAVPFLLFLVVVVLYFVHVFRVLRYREHDHMKPKKVYLIYKDIVKSHTDHVMALAEFLKENFNLQVWIDRNDIIRTSDRNPSTWSARCVEQADHVVVVAPPAVVSGHGYRSVYSYNFEIGCKHLDLRMKKLLSTSTSAGNDICTIVVLPDSAISALPAALLPYRRFNFPRDANKFEYYIWKNELKLTGLYPCFTVGIFRWFLSNRDRFYEERFNDIHSRIRNEVKPAIGARIKPLCEDQQQPEARKTESGILEDTVDDSDINYFSEDAETTNLRDETRESEDSETDLVFI